MAKQFCKEFTVKLCCSVLKLDRSTYYRNRNKADFREKYQYLKEIIKGIIIENPKYGYRRIKQALFEDKKITINHKPLRKLLNAWNFNLLRKARKPNISGIEQILTDLGPLANLLKTLTPDLIKPFQLIYADFTEITCKAGKLYLIPFLDHITKKIIGYKISVSPDAKAALEAFQRTRYFLKSKKIDFSKIVLHQDQGSVFKGYEYVQAAMQRNITLSYSRKARPSDNPEMESFFGRLKDDWRYVFWEAESLEELRSLIDKSIRYYNQDRIHSKLGGKSPDKFIINLISASQLVSTKSSR